MRWGHGARHRARMHQRKVDDRGNNRSRGRHREGQDDAAFYADVDEGGGRRHVRYQSRDLI